MSPRNKETGHNESWTRQEYHCVHDDQQRDPDLFSLSPTRRPYPFYFDTLDTLNFISNNRIMALSTKLQASCFIHPMTDNNTIPYNAIVCTTHHQELKEPDRAKVIV